MQLGKRIAHMLGIGRIRTVDDSGALQLVQVDHGALADGDRITDKVPRLVQFGMVSHPPAGSEVIILRVAGNRSTGVALATNHQPSRLRNLNAGDSALHDVRGAYLWLTEDGPVIDAAGLDIVIRNAATVTIVASDKVRIEAPRLEVTGDVVSRCDDDPVSLNTLHDAYNAHRHGGVQAGSSSTETTDSPA